MCAKMYYILYMVILATNERIVRSAGIFGAECGPTLHSPPLCKAVIPVDSRWFKVSRTHCCCAQLHSTQYECCDCVTLVLHIWGYSVTRPTLFWCFTPVCDYTFCVQVCIMHDCIRINEAGATPPLLPTLRYLPSHLSSCRTIPSVPLPPEIPWW